MAFEPRKCSVQKMDESNNLSRSFRFRFLEHVYAFITQFLLERLEYTVPLSYKRSEGD
jgi:hypothetical protein